MTKVAARARWAALIAIPVAVIWFAWPAPTPALGGAPVPATPGEDLGVAYDSGSGELVLEMGPINIAAGATHDKLIQPCPSEGIIPIDGWINGYRVELLDQNGDSVPQALIHHVNIIVPERRELFSQIMQRVGAAGRETAPVNMSRILGYPISKGDRILVTAMLDNPSSKAYEGVRVRVRMTHIQSGTMFRPIRIAPFYLDVMPPAGIHEFDLPPGHFEKSWSGKPALSGRIVALGGHLHKYAASLTLEDITTGKIVYEARPILDAEGNVIGMPQSILLWRLGLPIDSAHTYKVTAVYDNPTGHVLPGGGMGSLGGVMIASSGEAWPAIAPADSEYLADVHVTMEGHVHSPSMNMSSMPGMPGM